MVLTSYVCASFLLHCALQVACFNSRDVSTLSGLLHNINELLNQAMDVLSESSPNHQGPIDCTQIRKGGVVKSGIYRIWPLNWLIVGSFNVYCDMELDGGGWTVIQRRGNYNNSQDYFYKGWLDYQTGFGKLGEDFWLGNDRIFSLTNQGNYSLRIDMKDKEGNNRFALYNDFWIENEKQLYRLHLSGFTGDGGDSLSMADGMKFSTKDQDNDIHDRNHCANAYKGGWWYKACHLANLNGLYLDGYHTSYADGVNWQTWKGYNYSLHEVNMKIKRS